MLSSSTAEVSYSPVKEGYVALASHKTIFRVDYKPTLDFYDKLIPMAESFTRYPDWRTDRISITLQNFDVRCSVNLAFNSFWYVRDLKKENSDEEDDQRIREILEKVPTKLDKQKYERVGLRRVYLYPVEMSFENLVSVIRDKLFVQNDEINEGICPQPTDLAYLVDFLQDKLAVKLRVGPVRKEELEQQIQPDRLANLSVKERAFLAEELFAGYRDVSLLMDIDVSKKEPKASELLEVYDASQRVHAKLSKNVVTYVLGIKK